MRSYNLLRILFHTKKYLFILLCQSFFLNSVSVLLFSKKVISKAESLVQLLSLNVLCGCLVLCFLS